MLRGGEGSIQARRMKPAFKDLLKPNFKYGGRAVGCGGGGNRPTGKEVLFTRI